MHGKVQGVFFRDFTQKTANANNLTGFVQNSSDGKVRGEAQGEEAGLRELLKAINDGPRHAQVVKVEKKEIEVKEGETEFET